MDMEMFSFAVPFDMLSPDILGGLLFTIDNSPMLTPLGLLQEGAAGVPNFKFDQGKQCSEKAIFVFVDMVGLPGSDYFNESICFGIIEVGRVVGSVTSEGGGMIKPVLVGEETLNKIHFCGVLDLLFRGRNHEWFIIPVGFLVFNPLDPLVTSNACFQFPAHDMIFFANRAQGEPLSPLLFVALRTELSFLNINGAGVTVDTSVHDSPQKFTASNISRIFSGDPSSQSSGLVLVVLDKTFARSQVGRRLPERTKLM